MTADAVQWCILAVMVLLVVGTVTLRYIRNRQRIRQAQTIREVRDHYRREADARKENV